MTQTINIGLTDIQVYTTSTGNWTKQSWATLVRVICVGGGGGGSGGDKRTSASGGAGGGGSGRLEAIFQPASLGSTEAYAVGAGGTSGAAGTGSGGTAGGVGGNSTFGGSTVAIQTAYGGGSGGGGSNFNVTGGGFAPESHGCRRKWNWSGGQVKAG